MKKKEVKQVKRYRLLRADGKWWSEISHSWVVEINSASRMNEQQAKGTLKQFAVWAEEAEKEGDVCVMVEVGTEFSTRQLFKSMFIKALNDLAWKYGLTAIHTTYDTFYIGGWD